MDACRAFVEGLVSTPTLPAVFNPYWGDNPESMVRRHNLTLYLLKMRQRRPHLMLLGEAPGYRGCRVTGVPFTSASILLAGAGPFDLFGAAAGYCAAAERSPQREATATAVWKTLIDLDVLPLLWNAFPFHPYRPGRPDSNRPPTARELDEGRAAFHALREWFGIDHIVGVGNKAALALQRWGISAPAIRHPGHGGQAAFRRELEAILATSDGYGQISDGME